MENTSIEKLDFNYTSLISGDEPLVSLYHSEFNLTKIEKKLYQLFKMKMTLNASDLIKDNSHYKVTLMPGLNTNIIADNSDIFLNYEENRSKLIDFVPIDTNIKFTAEPNSDVEITGWDGCNKVSADNKECTVMNIVSNKTIIPHIQYVESIYNDNVKDLSEYSVLINDVNYTVNLDLDTVTTRRDFIESIVVDDVIIKTKGDNRFFRKVIHTTKMDDYNYILETEDMSFLDVYKQGGIHLKKNLTHEDLEKDLNTINRGLNKSNAKLLPPRHKNDDEFTIVFFDKNSTNRSLTLDGLERGHEFQQVIYNNGSASISIKGSITFKITTDFDFNSHWYGGLKSMRYVVTTETKGEVSLVANTGFSLADLNDGNPIRVSLLGMRGNEPKSINFNIPSGWLMLKADIKLFAGIEGSIASAVTIGGKRESVTRRGFNLYEGNIHSIKSTTSNVSMIGNLPNAKASVGGYLSIEPGIEALKIGKFGLEAKSGVYVEATADLVRDKYEGKLIWKNTIQPLFNFSWPVKNFGWAQKKEKKINDLMPSYTHSITLFEYKKDLNVKPAYLKLTSVPIDEKIYNDEGEITKSYNFTIENTGEANLKWKIKKEGMLSYLSIDLQETSGELEGGESIDIIVNLNIGISNYLVGDYLSGKLKFVNISNGSGDITKNISLEIIPRLVKPDNIENIYLTGESIKYLNFDLPEYSWSFLNANYFDRGFKIYMSPEVDGSCSDNYQIFHSINFIDDIEDINNRHTKVNFEEKREFFELENGKRYCFKLSSYAKGYSSQTTQTFGFFVPNSAILVSSVKDKDGNPIENATIRLTLLSNNTVTNATGDYKFENLMPGRYKIVVTAEGYQDISGEVTMEAGITTPYQAILLPNENLEDVMGTVNGKVQDATNGNGIANATITIRKGINITTGDILQTISTDSNGIYNVELETGAYTFAIEAIGYISHNETINSYGNETTTKDTSLSPILLEGQMRIILNWDATPRDLDSHLVKKTNGTENYHIYYAKHNKDRGHSKTVEGDYLDHDDTSSYGPETITIENINASSVYTYYVYNYSHNDNSELKNSQANITVEYGSASRVPRPVPNEDGYYWKVFEIVNGSILYCEENCIQDNTSSIVRNLNRKRMEEQIIFNNLPYKY